MSSVLSIADYVVIGIMLAISAGIGLYFRFTGGRQKTTREFLMADKNMQILPVSFSLMATIMSAIALLGSPSEVYFYGIEYLEKRFGKVMKIAMSLLFSLQMILYMPVVIYAPSLALSTVTGLPLWTSVVSLALVCTFYSTLGGLKAVLWTDLFQAMFMLLTTFILVIKGSLDLGGFSKVLEIAQEGGRLRMFTTNPDPTIRYTLWNNMAHGIVAGTFLCGTTFTLIQRLMSCGNLKNAQRALMWNIPLCFLFKASADIIGVVIYSYYYKCDPIQDKRNKITSGDQLVPYFILTLFGHLPGLPGFCIAGIFSAALSTMSSIVNSLVTVTIEDYIKTYGKCRSLKDSTIAFLAKILAIFYGGLCLFLTFVVANAKGVLEVTIVVMGMVGGPTLGVFFLGMFTTRVNEPGSLIGLCTGFAINAWIGFGSLYNTSKYPSLLLSTAGCNSYANKPSFEESYSVNSTLHSVISNCTDASLLSNSQERYIFPLYRVSYLWFATFSFVITVISGYIGSFIMRLWVKEKRINPLQLSPLVRKWMDNIPNSHAEKEYIKLSRGMDQTDTNAESHERNEKI